MHKLTKIVATIGPSCESEEMIAKLIHAGVDIFRFNFKHNTVEWHSGMIQRVNRVAARVGMPIGTLIDLQGPEIRINMPFDQIEVKVGQPIPIGKEAFESKTGFTITHQEIIEHIKEGQKIVADSGAFTFEFTKKNGQPRLIPKNKGILKQRKALNIPGADFPFPVLVDRDIEGLKLAEREQIDYVALSFVRYATDLQTIREEMKKYNVQARVIAKIETEKAMDHLDVIIDNCDGVMVARGDLGVELPLEEIPYHQKLIIKKAIQKGVPVITATQMLESMIENPYPTRAEVSDIANATYDLTDAVMLSAETASGAHPIEAVKIMTTTIGFNEKKNLVDSRLRLQFDIDDQSAMVCDAAYNILLQMRTHKKHIAGIVVYTKSGNTARLLSRYRPFVPLFAFVPDDHIRDQLLINFGVIPITFTGVVENSEVTSEGFRKGFAYLKEHYGLKDGDKVIVLHGDRWAQAGGTSSVKIISI